MARKSGFFRVKIEYEEIPLTDVKVKGLIGLDSVFKGVKDKMSGRRR